MHCSYFNINLKEKENIDNIINYALKIGENRPNTSRDRVEREDSGSNCKDKNYMHVNDFVEDKDKLSVKAYDKNKTRNQSYYQNKNNISRDAVKNI